MKREGDEKGTAEQSEAKNHPVNGFLVPRAGGDTAPVSPNESHFRHQIKIPPAMRGGIFIIFAQLRPYNIGKINIRIYQNGGNIIKIGIANNK